MQKEELLTAGQLQDKTDKDDLENELYDLRDEVSAGKAKTTTTNNNKQMGSTWHMGRNCGLDRPDLYQQT